MISATELITGYKAKAVYEWIRKSGTISKQELKERCGLTSSTLTRILEELSAQAWIMEVGLGESTGGRKPVLYEVNPTKAVVFGLDISRFTTTLLLCDMSLRKLDDYTWSMTADMTPERLIREVVECIGQMLDRNQVALDKVLGLGIGAVGPLDRFEGLIMNPQNFPSNGWKDVRICELLQEKLHIPVFLDNGANAALLGEYWSEQGERAEHLLYVHAGVGIRSAMMMGGKLVYGAVDMEGAVGQMIVQSDGLAPRSEQGNYGCWESYVSTYAIEQNAKALLKLGRSSSVMNQLNLIDDLKYSLLEAALHQGDALANEVFITSACYFGIGLANLLNTMHPQKVILGGPLVSNNRLFFETARRVALDKTYHYPSYQVSFERSRLADEAVAVGAVATVIQRLTLN